MRIAIDINDVIRDYTNQFKNVYTKVIDPSFNIEYDKIDDFNLINIFPFNDEYGNVDMTLYNKFKYEDCSFELYARADYMDRLLPAEFRLWTQNTLRNFDDDKVPEVLLFSPFEMNLSIQCTLSFLSKFGSRIREILFPIDSLSMWDTCDVMITANPNLIEATPKNKCSFKIEAPYNKNVKGTYNFKSLMNIIHDNDNTLINLIEKKEKE